MTTATLNQTQFEWLFTAFVKRTLKEGKKLGLEIPKDFDIKNLTPSELASIFHYGDANTRDAFLEAETALFDARIKFFLSGAIVLAGVFSTFFVPVILCLPVGFLSGWVLAKMIRLYKKCGLLYNQRDTIGCKYVELVQQKVGIQINNQAIYAKWAEEEEAERAEQARLAALAAAKNPSNFA